MARIHTFDPTGHMEGVFHQLSGQKGLTGFRRQLSHATGEGFQIFSSCAVIHRLSNAQKRYQCLDIANYLRKAFDAWSLLFNLMLSFHDCSAFMQ